MQPGGLLVERGEVEGICAVLWAYLMVGMRS